MCEYSEQLAKMTEEELIAETMEKLRVVRNSSDAEQWRCDFAYEECCKRDHLLYGRIFDEIREEEDRNIFRKWRET